MIQQTIRYTHTVDNDLKTKTEKRFSDIQKENEYLKKKLKTANSRIDAMANEINVFLEKKEIKKENDNEISI